MLLALRRLGEEFQGVRTYIRVHVRVCTCARTYMPIFPSFTHLVRSSMERQLTCSGPEQSPSNAQRKLLASAGSSSPRSPLRTKALYPLRLPLISCQASGLPIPISAPAQPTAHRPTSLRSQCAPQLPHPHKLTAHAVRTRQRCRHPNPAAPQRPLTRGRLASWACAHHEIPRTARLTLNAATSSIARP